MLVRDMVDRYPARASFIRRDLAVNREFIYRSFRLSPSRTPALFPYPDRPMAGSMANRACDHDDKFVSILPVDLSLRIRA